jgi:hypothetical protein
MTTATKRKIPNTAQILEQQKRDHTPAKSTAVVKPTATDLAVPDNSAKKARTTEDILKEQEAQAKVERENAFTVKTGNNALVGSADNPWLELGTQLHEILGLPRMKFSKEADYLIGESESVPKGTKVVGHADETELGWVLWENNQPVDRRWGRIAESFVPPPESELPNNEPIAQPDGSMRKPWQFGMVLPVTLMSEGGETYAFSVTSKGGIGAVSGVSRAYGKRLRDGKPGRPIIELKSDKYWSRRYHTWVNYPVLTITGWTDPSSGKPLSLKDDLNDDLPDNLKGKAA